MTVDIELARPVDGPEVVEALAAEGLEGQLVEDGGRVIVDAENMGVVEHVLDAWTLRAGLPFVPLQIASRGFVLAPPPA
jgi:hypothetical protein